MNGMRQFKQRPIEACSKIIPFQTYPIESNYFDCKDPRINLTDFDGEQNKTSIFLFTSLTHMVKKLLANLIPT